MAALAIRILFFLSTPNYTLHPDTFGYFEVGDDILKFPAKYFFNERRTPVYPLFVSIIKVATPDAIYFWIIFIQTLLGLLTLYILYKIMSLLNTSPKFKLFLLLFFSLNPLIFAWEQVLLTESLSIFLLTLSSYILLLFIKKPDFYHLLLLSLSSIFLFLLKPIFSYFPIISAISILLYKPTKQKLVSGIIFLTIFILVLITYINHNKTYFSYSGINRTTDINLLGMIIKFNLDTEKAKNIGGFHQKLTEYKKINIEPQPYRFLEYYDPQIYAKNEIFQNLQQFNKEVLLSNLPIYIKKSLLQYSEATLEISHTIPKPKDESIFRPFFIILENIAAKTLFINFLTFPLLIFSLYRFLKIKSLKNFAIFTIGVICTLHILTSIFFSYNEFGRLITPTLPLLYLFNFYSLQYLFLFLL